MRPHLSSVSSVVLLGLTGCAGSGGVQTADSALVAADTDLDAPASGAVLGLCRVRDCDDGDACTVDACDDASGRCQHDPVISDPASLFSAAALRDPGTLDVETVASTTVWESGVAVQVDEIRYTSFAVEACALRPLRIQAFVATPANLSDATAGLAIAHGLGGMGTAAAASGPAAALGVVAIAWSGPGQGESEGVEATPDHFFDTAEDPRQSWLWEHTVAGMRALDVLESWPGVDGARLGVTGRSAGGLVSLILAGVDARVAVAAPVSASGHMDLAIAATPTPGWEADLLAHMDPPRDIDDIEWTRFEAYLDPKNFPARSNTDLLLINGAQDEFFPINSTVATYEDLVASGATARISHVPDADHGWLTDADAQQQIDQTWTWWLAARLGLDPSLSTLPDQPGPVEILPWTCRHEGAPQACALVAAAAPDADGVQFTWSLDNARSFTSQELAYDADSGLWWAEILDLDPNTQDPVSFVLARYAEWSLTSAAHIPDGFSPDIIPTTGPP